MRVLSGRMRFITLFVSVALVMLALAMPAGQNASADPGEGDVTATAISAGGTMSCAIASGGTVHCWGYNDDGRLGNGVPSSGQATVQVSGVSRAKSIAAGTGHACAVVEGGALYCWGYNGHGEVGDGSRGTKATPVRVQGLPPVAELSAGDGRTCVVTVGADVYCWGLRMGSFIGDGKTLIDLTPVRVAGMSGVVSVAVGTDHACALVRGGAVKCWGRNNAGQLGDGTTTSSTDPVSVVGVTNAETVSAGGHQSCAVPRGSAPVCWGQVRHVASSSPVPVPVAGLPGVPYVSIGYNGNCVRITDGSVRCWAVGFRPISGTESRSPVPISGVTTAKNVSVGNLHACAVLADGSVSCWGDSVDGQVGDGVPKGWFAQVPVRVSGFGPGDPTNPTDSTDPEPTDEGCANTTYFFGVRGSGEDPQPASADGDDDGPRPSGIVKRLDEEYGKFFYNADRPNKGMGAPVGSMVRDVSKASQGKFIPLGIAYPAVKVSVGSPTYPIEYRSSVDLGSHTVVTVLDRLASYCRGKLPNVVLAGYSQGAHVVEDALAEINDSSPSLAALVKKVVLIASPIHRATGPENVGGALTAGALIQTARPGRAAFIAAHPGVVTSICRPGDIVCDASFADGLSDPSAFLGINPSNSLGARIHTSYEDSDIPCPVTDLQQFTTVCAANAVSQKFGWPLNRHVVSAPADPDSDRDRQYSTRPGQKVDVMYFLRKGTSAGISKLVNVFMYSTPVKVGTVTIGDDGFGVGSIMIPANAEPGAHKLVFRRDDGQTFTRSIVVGSSGDSELLLTLDGTAPDPEPYPADPTTTSDTTAPDDGNGSLGGTGSLGDIFGS